MKIITSTAHKSNLFKIEAFIADFTKKGKILADGNRNQIKIFDLNGQSVAIKSFKIPNSVNKFAYRFLRKSKAQRSFEYANKLIQNNILTPEPIAYAIENDGILFGKSYYICEHLNCDLTYRDLVENEQYPDRLAILKAFTAFTFQLHEKGINFLDHSPGNTLIVKTENGYDFYLVDLNRMEFKPMDFDARMKNFSRLTPKRDMVGIMGAEYSTLYGSDQEETIAKMWEETEAFQLRLQKKQKLKKKLKFWKK
ncbi:MAG: lipopolysaccharide kinase InaA family protein [Leeuwenhoekiella sp.]